jgi:uncharacterized spore protein YtfJ
VGTSSRGRNLQWEALEMEVENLLAKMADDLSVRRAFGTAYQKDGMLVIPVAMVFGGGGAGTSPPRRGNSAARPDGPPEHDAAPQDTAPQDSGRTDTGRTDTGRTDTGRTDTGGGFGAVVLPSGAYVVKGDEVRWVPAVDVTVVILASLSLVRLFTRRWTRRR